MQTVHYRYTPSKEHHQIDISSEGTLSDFRRAIIDRDGLDATPIRLVMRGKVLADDTIISTLQTSDRAPIQIFKVHGFPASPPPRPSEAPSPQPPPPTAPTAPTASPIAPTASPTAPTASPIAPTAFLTAPTASPPAPTAPTASPPVIEEKPPPIPRPADPGFAQLVEMGFDEGQVRHALELCRGNVETAADLLMSGNVSEAGLAGIGDDGTRIPLDTLPPDHQRALLQNIRADPPGAALLAKGSSFSFSTKMGWISVTPEMVRQIDGGGAAHPGGYAADTGELDSIQGALRGLSPIERAKLQELVREGFDTATTIQIFFACDRNVESARALLAEML